MSDNNQSLPPLEPEERAAMIHLLDSLARVFEENQREYERWKAERTALLNCFWIDERKF